MKRSATTASAARKSRDIAAVIPVVCALLMMPPLVHLTADGSNILGIPAIVVYLFGVWTAAIGLTAWNARRLDAPVREDQLRIDPNDTPP